MAAGEGVRSKRVIARLACAGVESWSQPRAVTLDSGFRRDVAQPGSALAWGARGREFKSRRPDQLTELFDSLKLSWGCRVLRAFFQDYGHFKQRPIGIFVGFPTEFVERRALE